MTPREITLLQTSFQKVAPVSEQTAAQFYSRLFELDPRMRAVFQGNLTVEGRKLMALVALTVKHLHRFDRLVPSVHRLGLRYAAYHLTENNYRTIGEALLWALARVLGDAFTNDLQSAWAEAYWIFAETLKAGGEESLARQIRATA